jgi:hypothetical protein
MRLTAAQSGLMAGVVVLFGGAAYLWVVRGPAILLDLAFIACL